MKRVVLHIGTGKTGTSTIQRALYRSRRHLRRRHGVDYARVALRRINHFGDTFAAHYPLVEALRHTDQLALQKVRSYLEARPEHTIIFSCEDLYHHLDEHQISRLKELLAAYRVNVVCYVRRQDKYIESAYKQRIKVGGALDLPRFLHRHTTSSSLDQVHANYYRMMSVWERAFGREAIVVRPFDASCFPNGDLLQDFVAAAGLADIELSSSYSERSNEALPAELVTVLRIFNETGVIPLECRPRFVDHLRKTCHFNDYPLVSPEKRAAILQNYAESNQQLFNHFDVKCNWLAPTDPDSETQPVTGPTRSDLELVTHLYYELWKSRQRGMTGAMVTQRFLYGLQDLSFYIRAVLGNRAMCPSLPRPDYLQLLRRMILRGDFSPSYYLAHNLDIGAEGLDPLVHYLRYGCREGRIPHPGVSQRQAQSITASVLQGSHPYLCDWVEAQAS